MSQRAPTFEPDPLLIRCAPLYFIGRRRITMGCQKCGKRLHDFRVRGRNRERSMFNVFARPWLAHVAETQFPS